MNKTTHTILTLFAIACVTLFPHTGLIPIPFAYSILVLLFIWLILRISKEPFSATGFIIKDFSVKALLVGGLTAGLLFAFLTEAFFPLLEYVVKLPPADLGDIAKIKGNTGFYLFLLGMGWLIGGFYEEIVFHGFIFTRLEKLFAAKFAVPAAFIISNIIFAGYHWQLGVTGVINAAVAGCVYHALMLRYKRNMWYAIFCHAVFDTIALTYIYAGY